MSLRDKGGQTAVDLSGQEAHDENASDEAARIYVLLNVEIVKEKQDRKKAAELETSRVAQGDRRALGMMPDSRMCCGLTGFTPVDGEPPGGADLCKTQ